MVLSQRAVHNSVFTMGALGAAKWKRARTRTQAKAELRAQGAQQRIDDHSVSTTTLVCSEGPLSRPGTKPPAPLQRALALLPWPLFGCSLQSVSAVAVVLYPGPVPEPLKLSVGARAARTTCTVPVWR